MIIIIIVTEFIVKSGITIKEIYQLFVLQTVALKTN
jgi:hypothetical protein